MMNIKEYKSVDLLSQSECFDVRDLDVWMCECCILVALHYLINGLVHPRWGKSSSCFVYRSVLIGSSEV